jgi:hypothetical protein
LTDRGSVSWFCEKKEVLSWFFSGGAVTTTLQLRERRKVEEKKLFFSTDFLKTFLSGEV